MLAQQVLAEDPFRLVGPPDIPARSPGLIEIALSDGTTVRVDARIDPRA